MLPGAMNSKLANPCFGEVETNALAFWLPRSYEEGSAGGESDENKHIRRT